MNIKDKIQDIIDYLESLEGVSNIHTELLTEDLREILKSMENE